jgi:hypothetical protein
MLHNLQWNQPNDTAPSKSNAEKIEEADVKPVSAPTSFGEDKRIVLRYVVGYLLLDLLLSPWLSRVVNESIVGILQGKLLALTMNRKGEV